MSEQVNHPAHYQSLSGKEVIDVIEDLNLGFHLGNAFKYIARAGHKDNNPTEQDFQKARWYVKRFCDWYTKNGDTKAGAEVTSKMVSMFSREDITRYVKTVLELAMMLYTDSDCSAVVSRIIK